MTNWISLDWDFVTGDCRDTKASNRCIMDCSGCGNTGKIGRGKIGEGYVHWRDKLNEVRRNILPGIIDLCIVRDNHGEIFQFLSPGDVVLNYDYHTDDYEKDDEPIDEVYCWNWVNHCNRNNILVQSYYAIGDLRLINRSGRYNLFIAWSTPYTRQDLDGHLFRFLMGLGKEVKLN